MSASWLQDEEHFPFEDGFLLVEGEVFRPSQASNRWVYAVPGRYKGHYTFNILYELDRVGFFSVVFNRDLYRGDDEPRVRLLSEVEACTWFLKRKDRFSYPSSLAHRFKEHEFKGAADKESPEDDAELPAGASESGGQFTSHTGLAPAPGHTGNTPTSPTESIEECRATTPRDPRPSAEHIAPAEDGEEDIGGKLTKEALALAALKDHADFTNKQIAELIGCNEKSLYRMKQFRKARQLLRSEGPTLPHGQIDKDGNLDAWSEAEAEE